MDASHLAAFARVLARTQTPEVSLWDAQAYERAVGWGAYFEKQVAQLRPHKDGFEKGSAAAEQEALDDDAWLHACLHAPDAALAEEGADDSDAAWVKSFWRRIHLTDLRDARARLVDRYILHSPFIDANPTLIRLVLDRAGGDDHGLNSTARLLDERYKVDSALAAAHESLQLLRSALLPLSDETAARDACP